MCALSKAEGVAFLPVNVGRGHLREAMIAAHSSGMVGAASVQHVSRVSVVDTLGVTFGCAA